MGLGGGSPLNAFIQEKVCAWSCMTLFFLDKIADSICTQ